MPPIFYPQSSALLGPPKPWRRRLSSVIWIKIIQITQNAQALSCYSQKTEKNYPCRGVLSRRSFNEAGSLPAAPSCRGEVSTKPEAFREGGSEDGSLNCYPDLESPNSIKCAGTILLFCKKIKKLSHYLASLYVNSQNFFRRFSHKTRRYVQGWGVCFF